MYIIMGDLHKFKGHCLIPLDPCKTLDSLIVHAWHALGTNSTFKIIDIISDA